MPNDRRAQVTALLTRWSADAEAAAGPLLALVYEDLRELADAYFRRQQSDHTLQPTALVHEAFIKLVDGPSTWRDRAHFFAVAATAMRQVLIDHARRRQAAKRGGEWQRVTLTNLLTPAAQDEIDVLALDEVLERLRQLDPRQHRVVELRFFAGLSEEEIGEVLDISRTTVQTEWRSAKAWLGKELKKAGRP